MAGLKIGLDMGTSSIKVCSGGRKGMKEIPGIAAVDTVSGKVLAYGEQAAEAAGRTPDTLTTVRVMRDGVICNYSLMEYMVRDITDRLCGQRILKPVIVGSVSVGVTSLEKKTVLDVLYAAGAAKAYLIEEPVASAIGVYGLEPSPAGRAVLDIGAGSADCAIVTMNSVAVSRSIPMAGDAMTDRLMEYLARERNILIGRAEAERLKRTLANAVMRTEEIALVSGGKKQSGEAVSFEVTTTEMRFVLKDCFAAIRKLVADVFDEAPPELVGDITENGILLTGGSAAIYGLDAFLSRATGLQVTVPEQPSHRVIAGIRRVLPALQQPEKAGFLFS
ncbi:MAG: rod shape-determining protein [Clostridia bacterium]|nr:rod shape-determining protein [Clostridia bacterium]